MKQTDIEILIQKYLNGETTPEEEKVLALEVSLDDAPQEWKLIAEMLGELTVDEALYDKTMAERNKKPRIIKLWPWFAAACVAALLVVFLAPPKEEDKQVAKVEKTIVPQKEVEDSVKAEPISQPMQEEKQLAQVSKRNSSDVKRNRKKAETIAEASQDAVAVTESSNMEEYNEEATSVADERMDEFYASSANIHRCGQQLKQRVATMLADQQTNPQYVNL